MKNLVMPATIFILGAPRLVVEILGEIWPGTITTVKGESNIDTPWSVIEREYVPEI